MSLSEKITSLRTMLDSAESEIKSLEGGRKASSARARKSLQSIKTECHGLRKGITNHVKSMETKTRVKKTDEPQPVEPEPVEPEPEEEPMPTSPPELKRSRTKKIPKE